MVRNFDRPDSGIVKIENPIGQLKVRTWDREDIEIRYRLYAEAGDYNESRNLVAKMQITVEESYGELLIKTVLPFDKIEKARFPYLDGRRSFDTAWEGRQIKISTYSGTSVQTEIEVSLPENTSLIYEGIISSGEIVSFSGNLDLSLEAGNLVLASTSGKQNVLIESGEIRLKKPGGDLIITTKSGNITGEIDDSLKIEFTTQSGEIAIEAENPPTQARISTQSGDFYYKGPTIPSAEIDSQSGDMDIEFTAVAECSISVTSQSGEIEIQRDKPGFAATELITESGKLSHPAIEKGLKYAKLENPEGAGFLHVTTQSGNIKVK